MPIGDRASAWQALQNPLSYAGNLGEIAYDYPEFGMAVASHPGACPELLEWLRGNGTPEARAAAETMIQQYAPYQSARATDSLMDVPLVP